MMSIILDSLSRSITLIWVIGKSTTKITIIAKKEITGKETTTFDSDTYITKPKTLTI